MNDIQDRLEIFDAFDPALFLSNGISGIIWPIFYILLGIFVMYSLMLLYHWLRHGSGFPMIWVIMIVYGVVSFGLLNTMFFSALAI